MPAPWIASLGPAQSGQLVDDEHLKPLLPVSAHRLQKEFRGGRRCGRPRPGGDRLFLV